MNFLAHLYLSGDNEDLMLGNFLSDAVKGRQYEQYAPGVRAGILLHRYIDTYTDQHPVVTQSKTRLRTDYGKFAGVITDLFYDHFLAVSWSGRNPQPLPDYVQQFYGLLRQRWAELPEKVRFFAPYMIRDNWLMRYEKVEGLQQSLNGLSRRVPHAEALRHATTALEREYEAFRSDFDLFFPDLEQYVAQRLQEEPLKQL